MSAYFAHSVKGSQGTAGWQLLRDHLRGVARLARGFAEACRPGDPAWAAGAEAAGLLHDLGKYRPEFQQMIRGLRAKGESTRHKQAGAAQAKTMGRPDVAFAIAGHHGGLYDAPAFKDLIAAPGGVDVATQVWTLAQCDCPELAGPVSAWGHGVLPEQFDLQVRLLFSCLVDADWLDTSEHQRRAKELLPPAAPPPLRPAQRLERVREFIHERAADPRLDAKVAALRSEVLDAALHAGNEASTTGIYSMTVPTGGGKTLSALAFALAHAAKLGLVRIIYVAPYLSIIEQNAEVIRAALGVKNEPGVVLEHHSLAEPEKPAPASGAVTARQVGVDEEAADAERLAENWEAPVVVTTSVQFYESLFASKPGRCRKLHNIARSVVILDECQTLPPGLTKATCRMLESFSEFAGCSIVLCTATQPAWNRDDKLLPEGLSGVREIVPEGLKLFERLRRARVTWPGTDDRWEWSRVAEHMLERDQALCVVNSKTAARGLFEVLRQDATHPESVIHLSTLMCPAHRLIVLARIRQLLKEGKPCHLVSTQLIEAGVDVDFPLLLRELAPLESIVQAAGRCNREGLLNHIDVAGRSFPGGEVIVFRSIDGKGPRDSWYRNGIATVEQDFLAAGKEPDIANPAHLLDYFRRLYRTGNLDSEGIVDLRTKVHFASIAERYRLIDDVTTPVVVAKWAPAEQKVADLLNKLRQRPSREIYRELGRYQVNLFDQDRRNLGATIVSGDAGGVDVCYAKYDQDLGLVGGAIVPPV